MGIDSPLLPLLGVSIGLLGLLGILVVAVMKLRSAGRRSGPPARIGCRRRRSRRRQSTRRSRRAGGAGRPSPRPLSLPGADGSTARSSTDCRSGSSSRTKRAWCAAAPRSPANGSGSRRPAPAIPYRSLLARWPAIGDAPGERARRRSAGAVVVLTESAAAPSPRLTVTVTRWTPRARTRRSGGDAQHRRQPGGDAGRAGAVAGGAAPQSPWTTCRASPAVWRTSSPTA